MSVIKASDLFKTTNYNGMTSIKRQPQTNIYSSSDHHGITPTQRNIYTPSQETTAEHARGMDPPTNLNPSYRARNGQQNEHPYSYPFYELEHPPTPPVTQDGRTPTSHVTCGRLSNSREMLASSRSDLSTNGAPYDPYASMTRPPTTKKSHVGSVLIGVSLTVALASLVCSVVALGLTTAGTVGSGQQLGQQVATGESD